MHRRPDRKLATLATALAVLPLLGGCVQATRHSNTMVFGTNTTVGVKIGTDAMQIPAVEVGYNRQEAVIMPLLANTGEQGDSRNKLSPCVPGASKVTDFKDPRQGQPERTYEMRPSASRDGTTAVFNADPCQFVGLRADNGGLYVQDSYSVLASFGAEISGNATKQEAAVGLAQYFATGVAAQLLAATGGAAVVSVGKAAEKSADSETKAQAAGSVLGMSLAAPVIAREAPHLISLNDAWKCGDPATENAKFQAIVADANAKLPSPSWANLRQAPTIDIARSMIRGSGPNEISQFVASQKAVCGG